MVTVNDMYRFTIDNDMMLLSNYSASFWSNYRSNHERFDNAFNRLYKSFKYFLQNDESVAEITTDFIEQVYNHLLLNDKKYSELYRINVIDDNDYSLLDNYNMTEKMDRDTTDNGGDTQGARTDNTVYGSRTDTTSYTKGEQHNTNTDKVSPFDSENFYNDRNLLATEGNRTDSGSNTKGSETDNYTKGSQSNTYNKIGTEDYTLTRKGNIGIKTVTNMLDESKKFWTPFEFYTMIFGDICRELLLV